MEGGLGGSLYSSMGSGMLGLEMPLHQNPQNAPNPQNPHSLHHPQMVSYAHHEAQPNVKSTGYPYNSNSSKSKQQLSLNSDEDEPGFAPDDSSGDPKRKSSPWQRMKWTDTMVRLLIMAVFYIGDEGATESNDPKKKPGGLLQKKGKWKSVSRAMMEKGFYVSPQQCEDKFNDLNKRYKRVNDILGKGTACRVVENQALLETMDLSPKLKEEAKKLLNSKHLFFREMCAYHTSCGHVAGGGSGAHHSPEMATTVEPSQPPQRCFHSVAGERESTARTEGETAAKSIVKAGSCEEEYDDDDVDDDDDEEDDDDEDDEDDGEEVDGGGSRGHNGVHGHEDNHGNEPSRKRPRKSYSLSSAVMKQLSSELMAVMQDAGKSPWEKRQWMKLKLVHLEEQQVSYQGQAYELERERFKWVKYSSKKERDMERAKLENERRRLENERMVLLVRQKELELMDVHQPNSSNKRSDPSTITG